MQGKVLMLYILTIILLGIGVFIGNEYFDFIDRNGLIATNIVLGGISILTYRMMIRGIKTNDGQSFMRAKYSSTMVKFFACIFVLTIYIVANRAHLDKNNVFIIIGFYIIYSVIEASVLSKAARTIQN